MSQLPDVEVVRRTLTADLPAREAGDRAAVWSRVSGPAPARLRAGGYRRRRQVVPIVVPAIVIAAALTVLIAFSGGGTGLQPPGPLSLVPADARAILARAADHLGAGRPLEGKQARVVRETWLQLIVSSKPREPVISYVLPRTTESGYDALGSSFYEELPDGTPRFASSAAKATYTREFGPYVAIKPKPRIESHAGPNQPDPNYLNLSAHQVLSLPTDPTALKARLIGQRSGLIAQSEPHNLVYLASRLLTFGPTPPAVQAALARLLADLPGVRRAGTATIGGRPAEILAFPPQHDAGVAQRLAFDRRSGALLEELDVLTEPSPGYPGVRPGTVINAIAYSTAIAATIDTPVHPAAVAPAMPPQPTDLTTGGQSTVPRTPATPSSNPAGPSLASGKARPACRSLPPRVADVFAYAVRGTPAHATLVLRQAKLVCGGPDDLHLEPVGARRTERVTPGVNIRLLVQGATGPQLRAATLSQLTQLFAHTHDFQFERYFTGQFRVQSNEQGQINSITELYHP